MEKIEFCEKVCASVKDALKDTASVEIRKIRKNNGVVLNGLMTTKKEGNVAPTIYLETFYAAYEDGISFQNIIDRILRVIYEETPDETINMEFFRNFENVKDRICYKLVQTQANRELLEDIPHFEYLDLSVCFYYAYKDECLGEGSILIHNTHLKLWGQDKNRLMEMASRNTPRLLPVEYVSMKNILLELAEEREEMEAFVPDDIPMYVLTNPKRNQGAACILYPGVLQEISGKLGKSYYLIPSSVHEVIILTNSDEKDKDALKHMIFEVNRNHVEKEDVLSDSLYYYDGEKGKLEIVE